MATFGKANYVYQKARAHGRGLPGHIERRLALGFCVVFWIGVAIALF